MLKYKGKGYYNYAQEDDLVGAEGFINMAKIILALIALVVIWAMASNADYQTCLRSAVC